MKYVPIASLVFLVACSDHRPRIDRTPPCKTTRTITETVKFEKPVPVYKTETTVQSRTKTIDDKGNTVAPLHKAEIIPDAPK